MKADIKKISINEAAFPELLKQIPGPPQLLYFLGRLPEPEEKLIAIVGTRKATSEGKLTAKRIAKELTEAGLVVVSGLALGIDSAAHEGVLTRNGKTIAVLANGLPKIYPPSHEKLAERIIENSGAIFSEYPPETPPYPNQFLERNRLISGLAIATIIIEAPIRSGALVTAKNALDQGREVFVVPGPANHPNYGGSHMLIRNGARLVTKADDILEDLGIEREQDTPEIDKNLSNEAKALIEVIKRHKLISVDKIIEETKLETHKVNQELTFLLFSGVIEEKGGKFKIKS